MTYITHAVNTHQHSVHVNLKTKRLNPMWILEMNCENIWYASVRRNCKTSFPVSNPQRSALNRLRQVGDVCNINAYVRDGVKSNYFLVSDTSRVKQTNNLVFLYLHIHRQRTYIWSAICQLYEVSWAEFSPTYKANLARFLDCKT